ADIVHRDLKPSNIFVVRQGKREFIKVLDFGLAKLLARSEKRAAFETQQGHMVGTPAYMSPEQVLGHAIDHRSDLWQLGILAFECLCARRPFECRAMGE